MLYKFQSRKKFQQKLVFSFSFFSLLLAACTPSVQAVSSKPNLDANKTSLAQQEKVDYTKAITAIDPHVTEQNYVNANYEKYLNQALTQLNQATPAPSKTLSLTSPEVITAAKSLVQPKAADYAHFKYIADRSFSISWTTLKPGSLFYGGVYGTGWIADRFKNPDGSWSNDFLVSTNVHVVNTISDSSDSNIGSTNNYVGFPNGVYELGINNQVYDPKSPGDDWIYPASFAKLPNWNPKNYFMPNRRVLVNQIKNNFQVHPYYSLAFAGNHWNHKDFKDDVTSIKRIYNAIYRDETKNTHWYDPKNLATYLLDKISGSKRYYNQLFFDPTNISQASSNLQESFQKMYQNQLDSQFISDAVNEIFNRTKTLDNAYLRVTIPNDVLAEKLPVFLDPNKYNQWTFPKFAQQDAFKNYSFDNYQQPYGFLGDQTNIYNLTPEQQEPIWHAGYPAEQTWNGLAYDSPGPVLKTSRGMITNAIFQDPSSQKNLDHNECQFYNSLCNNDWIEPAIYSLGSEGSDTGGGSSGSMALNKNYEVQGIYWGVQYNSGSILNYNSVGLYDPMYSSSKLDLPTFEISPFLTPEHKGAITYKFRIDGKGTSTPFADLIKSYLKTGLEKVFVAAKTDDLYSTILSLGKLKSFDYSTNLVQQIEKIMGTLTDNNPSDLKANSFEDLTTKLNGLSDVLLQDHLYTAIKTYWQSFYNEAVTAKADEYKAKFYENFNKLAGYMSRVIDSYVQRNKSDPSQATINFTAFAKRDLGTVNMAAELQKYFQKNHYQSQVYNNRKMPLKIVNEGS